MRLNNIRFPGTLIAMAAIMFTITTASSAQTNLTGSWALEVSTDQGVTMPQLTLVQDGMKLTGDYSSDALGKSPVLGHLWGTEMRLSFSADIEGRPAQVIYLGTVEEDGTITGTIDIGGGRLMGTFTADRSPRWAGPR